MQNNHYVSLLYPVRLSHVLFLLTFVPVLGVSEDGEFACPEHQVYFPIPLVEKVFSESVTETTPANGMCEYQFRRYGTSYKIDINSNGESYRVPMARFAEGSETEMLLHESIELDFDRYDSARQAKQVMADATRQGVGYSGVTSHVRRPIGDEGKVIFFGPSSPIIVMGRQGPLVLKAIGQPPFATPERLEKIVVLALSTPPSVSSAAANPASPLTFTPDTVSAGVEQLASAITDFGEPARYHLNQVAFRLTGPDLALNPIQTDNRGTDGRPGMTFHSLRLSADKSELEGVMTVKPTAHEGTTHITVLSRGLPVSIPVQVTITGTQYLTRSFRDNANVKFIGNWWEAAPNPRVIEIERQVRDGFQKVDRPAYRLLRIQYRFYEQDYWATVEIRTRKLQSGLGGYQLCGDPFVHILGDTTYADLTRGCHHGGQAINETLVHESAHKLHCSYYGFGDDSESNLTLARQYLNLNPSLLFHRLRSSFLREWDSAAGDLTQCPYLPVSSQTPSAPTNGPCSENLFVTWKGLNEGNSPRCGFAEAYGASDIPDVFHPARRASRPYMYFFEDVATLTTKATFHPPSHIASGDTSYALTYQEKLRLLKKYGYIP